MSDRTQSFEAGKGAAINLGQIGIWSSHAGAAR